MSDLNSTFDLRAVDTSEPEKLEAITLWIPVRHKLKFDRLQECSKKQYGKHLKGVVMRDLDAVKIEEELKAS